MRGFGKLVAVIASLLVGQQAANADLIGQWHFNGDAIAQTGGTLTAGDGTLENIGSTDPAATNGQPGNANGALRFNGDNYVEFADAAGLNGLATGSVAFFARWNGTQASASTFDIFGTAMARQWDGAASDFALGLTSADPNTARLVWHPNNSGGGSHAFGNFQAGDGIAGSGTVVGDGVWRHVAVTFDGNDHKVYLDGNLEIDATVGGSFFNSATRGLSVGKWVDTLSNNGYSGMDGDIDFFSTYNHALTQVEITTLFNAGADLSGAAVPEPSAFAFLFGMFGVGCGFRRKRMA